FFLRGKATESSIRGALIGLLPYVVGPLRNEMLIRHSQVEDPQKMIRDTFAKVLPQDMLEIRESLLRALPVSSTIRIEHCQKVIVELASWIRWPERPAILGGMLIKLVKLQSSIETNHGLSSFDLLDLHGMCDRAAKRFGLLL